MLEVVPDQFRNSAHCGCGRPNGVVVVIIIIRGGAAAAGGGATGGSIQIQTYLQDLVLQGFADLDFVGR